MLFPERDNILCSSVTGKSSCASPAVYPEDLAGISRSIRPKKHRTRRCRIGRGKCYRRKRNSARQRSIEPTPVTYLDFRKEYRNFVIRRTQDWHIVLLESFAIRLYPST